MWTRFWDMRSGGRQKLQWSKIYIEAPERVARVVFTEFFDRDPSNVTCPCCGEDYSVSEAGTLEEVTQFDRVDWSSGEPRDITMAEYATRDDVIILSAVELRELR